MSQRQTIIFNPFSFYSLEYAGAQGNGIVAFPVIQLLFLPKNIKNIGDGGKGLLDALLALILLFYLILVLSSFYLHSALNAFAIWAYSALFFCPFHKDLPFPVLYPFSAFFLCSVSLCQLQKLQDLSDPISVCTYCHTHPLPYPANCSFVLTLMSQS